ncbi:hypothetical protein FQR65_LT18329 [Abscondita terminalis]|nr:hypothetical protein FQR65_LT18329 [Abscondita terminalis]
MEIPKTLKNVFMLFQRCKSGYIEELRDIVAIPSMSSSITHRHHLNTMVQWMAARLRKIGVEVSFIDLGTQMLADGKTIPCPPIILGHYKSKPKGKTICVYGHVDVYSVKTDTWFTNPFELTERDGKLYGRGVSDNKGQLLCWIHAIEGFQALGYDVPVNIKFIIEPMSACLNYGLYESLKKQEGFLKDIDYICITDTFWLGSHNPCITYSMRGVCDFLVEIDSMSENLPIEMYDGMSDMIYLLDSLVDNKGNILIPGIDKNIAPLTLEEKQFYSNIDFDMYDFSDVLGGAKLKWENDKLSMLSHLWRYHALSIHGIENPQELVSNEYMSSTVKAKFSIRLVPNQTTTEIKKLVFDHFAKKWETRGSPNKLNITTIKEVSACTEDPKSPQYSAGKRAIQLVYNKTPNLIRDGNTIPVALYLKELIGKNILFLPIFSVESGSHIANEKIFVREYIDGTKVLAAYLREMSLLS